MVQALFDINADGGNQGFSATNSQVLTLRLRQQPPLGVATVLWQVFDPAGFNADLGIAANPPRASLSAPALTVVGATSGSSASPATVDGSVTITMPATGSHSWIVRCVVNGSYRTLPNGTQVLDPTLIQERGIWIPTVFGARKVVCTELRQFSDGGWADALAQLPDVTIADHAITYLKLPSAVAAPSFIGAAVNGDFLERAISTLAGAGLALNGSTLDVTGSTSITVASDQVQRAALTGAITSALNSNATAFGSAAAKSVLANATNGSAVPAFLAGTAAFQYLRVNSANNALEMATLSSHASTTVTYTANTFVVALGADFAWTGWHSLAEQAAHGTVGAGVSAFWAKNTAPTTPMFTDDDGNDWALTNNTVASLSAIQSTIASTSTIVAAAFTAPAGSWRVGTLYKLEAYLVATRGGTTTASNLIIELLLGGTVFASVTIPITPSGGGSCLVNGYLLCLSTGASGTFIGNLRAPNDLGDLTAVTAASVWSLQAGSYNTAAFGTTKSTAATQVVQLQARMSAAVSALSITWTAAAIVRGAL
jgi:peptidoglycan hydrolase-like protein with peptidoglycan-binding domain